MLGFDVKRAAAGTLILISAVTASFQSASALNNLPQASFAAVGEETSIPYGWLDFCHRHAGECGFGEVPALDVNLTADSLKELQRIDKWVNKTIIPVSDKEHWGVPDQWDIPTDGKGDCEDYALFKRKLLIAEGFPRQALLMTVVRDEQNEGHAILTVKTNHGEFVLDNLNDELKPWDRTGYKFVKRQSQTDDNVWVQVGPSANTPAYASR